MPAATATAQTLTCNLQVSGGALTSPVKGNITIQSNNGKTATASISSTSGAVACSLTGLTQNCTNQLAAGTSYPLTASVSGGTTVVGWAGDCSGTGNTANLTVPATGVTQVSCTLVVNGPGALATVPVAMTIKSDNAQSVIASVAGFANGVSCNIAGTSQSCTPQVDPVSSPVTLTGIITAGKFVGWSGDCQNTTPTSPSNPTTVTARLAVPANASSLSCTLIISGTQPGLIPVTVTLNSLNNVAAKAYITSDLAGFNQQNCSLAGTSAQCAVMMQSGQTYKLMAHMLAGAFFGWTGDCTPDPSDATGQTAILNMSLPRSSFACTLSVNGQTAPTTVPANITIQSNNNMAVAAALVFSGGDVSSTNSISDCNVAGTLQSCVRQLTAGQTYTLTPSISYNSATFVAWSGDCTGNSTNATLGIPTAATSVNCTLVLNGTGSLGNKIVTVGLSSPKPASAYITSVPGGLSQSNCSLAVSSATGGQVQCQVTLTNLNNNPSGTLYTLTPAFLAPSTSANFFGWNGDCLPVGSSNTATLLVTQSKQTFNCTLVLQ